MANDFKRFCVPSVGTSNTTLYRVPVLCKRINRDWYYNGK